jgi:hypothetical protein
MKDFEKLGVFYLGRESDPEGRTLGEPVLYDSRHLVTHALCVGMTGSGKTGLCLSLIEEAAIDGVPTIAIDPKGDLSNLLLTFPRLAPDDFRPWIDEDEARRAGVTPDAFAAQQAETWKSSACAPPPTSPSTPPAAAPAGRCRSCRPSRRLRLRLRRARRQAGRWMARRWPTAPRRRRWAC